MARFCLKRRSHNLQQFELGVVTLNECNGDFSPIIERPLVSCFSTLVMLTVLSAPMHRLQLLRFGQLTNRLRGETSGIGRQSAARSCSLSAGLVVL